MAAKDKNNDGYYETVTQFYESENPVLYGLYGTMDICGTLKPARFIN